MAQFLLLVIQKVQGLRRVVPHVLFNSIKALHLVKFSADKILKYFSYFSQETGFDISCKFVSTGDNLHEMSNIVPWEK